MKLRTIIPVLALLPMVSTGALAIASVGGSKAQDDAKQQSKLDYTTSLLDRLAKQGALEITPDGKVVVKDSVIDQLEAAIGSGICD